MMEGHATPYMLFMNCRCVSFGSRMPDRFRTYAFRAPASHCILATPYLIPIVWATPTIQRGTGRGLLPALYRSTCPTLRFRMTSGNNLGLGARQLSESTISKVSALRFDVEGSGWVKEAIAGILSTSSTGA